jgi:hypothetical protein
MRIRNSVHAHRVKPLYESEYYGGFCIGSAMGSREEYSFKCVRYIRSMKGVGQVRKQNCFTFHNKKREYHIKPNFTAQ